MEWYKKLTASETFTADLLGEKITFHPFTFKQISRIRDYKPVGETQAHKDIDIMLQQAWESMVYKSVWKDSKQFKKDAWKVISSNNNVESQEFIQSLTNIIIGVERISQPHGYKPSEKKKTILFHIAIYILGWIAFFWLIVKAIT